jgi:hypothetical protein
MRYMSVRYTPMRCTPVEVHAHKIHAWKAHAHQMHIYSFFARYGMSKNAISYTNNTSSSLGGL